MSAPLHPTTPAAYRLSDTVYDLAGVLLGLLALPLLPLLLLTRHGRGLGERLGRLPRAVRRLRRPVWMHAASVGEVLAAEPLVQQLRRQRPDLPLLVSTTSVTGRETARARLSADAVLLLPVDVACIIGAALRRVQPAALIIVETELWPALIRAAARQGVPRLLVSGRISARAAARYAWVPRLTGAMLARLDALAMQTDADAARATALGAPAARVQVLGSLKFAREAAAATSATNATAPVRLMVGQRAVLVAASTHAGEEHLAVQACEGLWNEYPDLLLLIAPRRPERFDEVADWLAGAGVQVERRSRVHGVVAPTTQVLLLDSIGELLDVLPIARGVFVGGTIAPVGGHNVLEPALFARPAAFGPHLTNVADAAAALLAAGAAVQVRDAQALGGAWRQLLAAPAEADVMGRRGHAVVAERAAVAAHTFELVARHLAPPAGAQ